MTELEPYFDPILSLVSDPNLNKEKFKTDQLITIINNFPLTERRISKLCTLSFQILKDLERIELKTKNWAFLSLDINSESHFDEYNSPIKKFNHDLAKNVLGICQELHKILYEISIELDNITNSIQHLTPLEYISDSGTLLTQFCLRNIKLKSDLSDKISIAYSKSKLISMGNELEIILTTLGGNEEEFSTIQSYKTFVISLLKQLNMAIEQNDQATKNECMAVVTDVEKMFEAYRLEKAQTNNYYDNEKHNQNEKKINDKHVNDENESEDLFEEYPTTPLFYKSSKTRHAESPPDDTLYDFNEEDRLIANKRMLRRSSISSMSTSSTLQKTTITDELPYLLNAFDSAKHIEEDISVYLTPNESKSNSPTSSSHSEREKVKSKQQKHELNKRSSFTADSYNIPHNQNVENSTPQYTFHYPDNSNPLYQQSQLINPNLMRPPSIFGSGNLLTKFGIKPQVISAPSSTFNGIQINRPPLVYNKAAHSHDKKRVTGFPLTKANLNSINEQNEFKLVKNSEAKGEEYIDIDDLVE